MKGIIYCNPNSIFALRQAQFYAKKGIDFWIITYHPFKEFQPSVYDSILERNRIFDLRKTNIFLNAFYILISRMFKSLVKKKFDKNGDLRRSLDVMISNLLLKRIKPDFIFGHNLITYSHLIGNAPSTVKRIIMPYGGDIHRILKESKSFHRINKVLNNIDLFVPSAEYAKEVMIEKYSIPPHKIKPISWGVDSTRFEGKDKETSRKIVLKYLGVNPNDRRKIVLNIRRFRPVWGSQEVFEAMKTLCQENVDFIGILVCGAGSDMENFNKAKKEVENSEEYTSSIYFLEPRVDQILFDHIINSSDIFLSILKVEDMRSSSILEGIAAKSVPLITYCKEYGYMNKLGFQAFFTKAESEILAQDLIKILRKNDFKNLITNNTHYIEKYEQMRSQLELMLEILNE